MAIPDFQSLMRPILVLLIDGAEWSVAEIREALASEFQLSDEERQGLLPSGTQRIFDNRVNWAISYLFHVDALVRPSRARYRITERGRQLADQNPDRVDLGVLSQFPELEAFRGGRGARSARSEDPPTDPAASGTPLERIDAAVSELHHAVAGELLVRVRSLDPTDFERLVVILMRSMGYGGSAPDSVRHLGGTGDQGVDGVIDEDSLGLDQVYIQAKRWSADHPVSRPDIQGFVGALEGKRASKGVFITTSRFTQDAIAYAESLLRRVVLIDGDELADLMLRHGVGVDVFRRVELARLNEDFFDSSLS